MDVDERDSKATEQALWIVYEVNDLKINKDQNVSNSIGHN
jgi:hypothetical protein